MESATALFNTRLDYLKAQPDLLKYYKNKYVLVTGGHGFIGQYVVKFLEALGAHCMVVNSIDCDLTSQLDTFQLFKHKGPFGLVFHLAARWMGIGNTSVNPAKSFYDNLQMGMNVIDTCNLFDKTKVVVAGSVCAYPANAPVPYREHSLYSGEPEPTNGPYGLAKRSLLTMLQAYNKQYSLPSVYLLLGNTYGPGDNFDPISSHVIPALIRKFVSAKQKRDKEVLIWGSGRVTRSFCYVADTAAGLVMAGARMNSPHPVNVGSPDEIFIEWLANKLKTLTHFYGDVAYDTTRPQGQVRRSLNVSEAYRLMAWEPQVKIDEGLTATLDWYRKDTEVSL